MAKQYFKQIFLTIIISLVALFAYANVAEAVHIHSYSAATCTSPKKCSCGKTSGSALGHNYDSSGRCTRCGATTGSSSGGSSSGGSSSSHVHTYSAATCTSPKKCTTCGAMTGSALGHNYTVSSSTSATCTSAGSTVYKCTRCGATQSSSTSALGHNYVVTSSTAATCTSAGKTVKKCSRCGDTQTSTTAALGHTYQTTSTNATCTVAGKITKTCSRCGDTQTTSTPALGHDYHVTTNISATCTTGGKVVKTCSRCGDKQETSVAGLGHDYVQTTSIPATCTTKGKVVKTCSRCGDAQASETPALGHDYKVTTTSATCTTGGRVTKKCSRCGDTIVETTPAAGHKYVVTSTTATCTTAGKTTKKCSVCGDEIVETGKPLGHDFKESSRKEPTCTEAGEIVYKCSRCGATEKTVIPALGHEECIVYNTTHHWYECDRCGKEITSHELHDFDSNNVCRVCGYKKGTDVDDPTDPDDEPIISDGELIIEPWMKENDELNCLAVSLRSEPYEEDRANKNIYALDEKVIYYVDYKNGGKTITGKVKLVLNLPLAFSVVESDGATVSKSSRTFTWTFDGMQKGDCGTKVVVVRYTSLRSSSATYKKITPKATISVDGTQKDVSAVINLIVKDLDTEINDTHYPYMYGDEDTGTFRPDATIKRGEGALVFTRIFGISTKYDSNTYAFPDLDETYLEARRAVIAATAYGIIEGYPDGTYKPNKAMTRGEFITILARQIEEEYGEGFEVKDEDELIKVYKDRNRIYYISDNEYYDAHWSVSYATLLARLNMTPLSEDDTNLRVDDPITRAEVAQLVNFYLLRAPAKVTSSTRTKFPDVSRTHKLFADIVEATRDAHNYSITEEAEEVAE